MDGLAREAEAMKTDQRTTFDVMIGQRFLTTMPTYWLGGFYTAFPFTVFSESVGILMPSDFPKPLTVEFVNEILQLTSPDTAMFTPSIIKALCQDSGALETLSKVKVVTYAGAPLDKEVGDLLLQRGTRIFPGIGSVEMGKLPICEHDPEEWNYYEFLPAIGIHMEPTQDDLYELVIRKDPAKADCQTIFHVYPHLEAYFPQDLYRRHPDPAKGNLWLYAGRANDLVKTAWLTKVNGREVESAVAALPGIESVMIAGDGRDFPCLLVEFAGAKLGLSQPEVMETVWAAVDKVNQSTAEAVRVKRELILLADPQRPFKTLSKGTLDRRGTVELYREDIEGLYASLGIN